MNFVICIPLDTTIESGNNDWDLGKDLLAVFVFTYINVSLWGLITEV